MKRLIAIVCVLVIVLQVGCAKHDKKTEEKNDVNDIIVEPGDVGPSFLLNNGALYGWLGFDSWDDSYLVDEDKTLMMQDVESFQYQECLYDDIHGNEYGDKMLYVKKNDGTFWMRGYDLETVCYAEVMHNYKKLTKVMNDVKTYYKKTGPAVYVVKNDNSLWFWAKDGAVINGHKEYDFIKVMDDVKSVSIGASADYIVKTDDSLWAFDSGTWPHSKYPFEESPQKIMDNILWCNVEDSVWGDYQETAACDNYGNLWYWINEGKKQKKNAVPKIVAENVTKFVKYGDSESGYQDVYYRNDNSAFTFDPKRGVIELGTNVKKAYVVNDRNWSEYDRYYVLDYSGELYKFIPSKSKKVLISSNVKDFCSSIQVKNLWILKDDNSLVTDKGKIYLENVSGIYMGESLAFGQLIAIADNKVYELIDKGPNYLFDLEE